MTVSENWSLLIIFFVVVRHDLWRLIRKFTQTCRNENNDSKSDLQIIFYIALFVSCVISKNQSFRATCKAFIQSKFIRLDLLVTVCCWSCLKFIFLLRYTTINGRCSTYDAWNASSYAWNAAWVSSKKDLILHVHTVHFKLSQKK